MHCEHTATNELDSTLRSVDCDKPALISLYNRETLDVVGHVCLTHANVYPNYGHMTGTGVSIKDIRNAELSADHEWAMAQRTPEGFGGESEDDNV
jgi:hypothetical protein